MPPAESRLSERLCRMEGKIDHLRTIMDGGISPEEGIIVRMALLEATMLTNHDNAVRQRTALWGFVAALAITVIGSIASAIVGLWIYHK